MPKNQFSVPKPLLDFQRQLLEVQKGTFQRSFNAMATLQEQQEKAVRAFMDRVPGVPEEAQKVYENWLDNVQASRETYRESTESSFDVVERFLDRLEGTDKNASEDEAGENQK